MKLVSTNNSIKFNVLIEPCNEISHCLLVKQFVFKNYMKPEAVGLHRQKPGCSKFLSHHEHILNYDLIDIFNIVLIYK